MYRYIFDMRSNECLVTIGWKYYRYKGHNLQNPGDGSALPLELRITANTAKREEEADCNLLLMKIQFLSPLLHIIASPYIVWYFNSGLLLTKSIVYVIFEYCNVQINFFLYFKKNLSVTYTCITVQVPFLQGPSHTMISLLSDKISDELG
jgi:hypothetical protein